MSLIPDRFHLDLVSPEAKLLSEDVWQVNIPGEEGDVSVLPGHMALVMTMRPGVVVITRRKDGPSERVFVSGGFVDIAQAHCTILAEYMIPVADLNPENIQAELDSLKEKMETNNFALRAQLQQKMVIATEMLNAVKRAA